MSNYYNEWEPYAADWIRNLIKKGLIPDGEVDQRSIADVSPDDLRGFTQCHFFAGIAGFSLALKLAGWPEDRPIWSGSAPCFTEGTMVLTDTGYRPIESLAIGDIVLTHLGRWRKINAVMSRDNADLIRVRAQGVPDVITTPEHPFWARTNKRVGHFGIKQWNEPGWIESKNLTNRHYASQVLPETTTDNHTCGFWWLVGRYLADGWRRIGHPNQVTICCGKSETNELSAGFANAGFTPSVQEERTVFKYRINDREFYEFLEQFGDKAHGKRIPKIALELDEQKSRALLEGYLSGDGYREDTRTNHGSRATTVSRSLALGVALLAQRAYGIVASVRKCKMPSKTFIEGREVNQKDFYVVSIPDRNRSGFVENNYGWKLIRKIEPCGIGRVYNIGVEEDESYCAEGAVVHNCQPFSVAGKGKGTADERHLWPHLFRLISACKPDYAIGEQVGGAAGLSWLDGVFNDLESENYSCQAFNLSACSVNAPHIRERLYWVGKNMGQSNSAGWYAGQSTTKTLGHGDTSLPGSNSSNAIDNTQSERLEGWVNNTAKPSIETRDGDTGSTGCDTFDMADTIGFGRNINSGSSWSGEFKIAGNGENIKSIYMAVTNINGHDGAQGHAAVQGGYRNNDGISVGSSGDVCSDLANANSGGCVEARERGTLDTIHPRELHDRMSAAERDTRGIDMADSASEGLEGSAMSSLQGSGNGSPSNGHWDNAIWLNAADGKTRRAPGVSQPRLCGMADGLSDGMDGMRPTIPLLTTQAEARTHKLKALGNAIVPQLAAEFIKAIMQTNE